MNLPVLGPQIVHHIRQESLSKLNDIAEELRSKDIVVNNCIVKFGDISTVIAETADSRYLVYENSSCLGLRNSGCLVQAWSKD